jgi:hypothetical protein
VKSSTLGFAVGVIPAFAFTLHDFILQLPDNHHEPTPGVFLTVGGLLFVWGLSGYVAARGTHTLAAAIKAAAVTGTMSAAILWLTFIVLNNLFIDSMSYEPDRIRAFQQSGFPTTRAYVNHGLFLGLFFPMLMAAATITASVGGMISCVQRRNVWRRRYT